MGGFGGWEGAEWGGEPANMCWELFQAMTDAVAVSSKPAAAELGV